jgi:high-affinity iron transporter
MKMSLLALQAATGLAAILVLLIIMNWFFHKVYWAGWISMHTRKRQALLLEAKQTGSGGRTQWLGFALLGFTSFYREGFEVVLFLQTYRMRVGGWPVLYGVAIGVIMAGAVAILTFVAHWRLPYRKMLVLTGSLLGGVLLVMVGEQAQEMQLAHWLPPQTCLHLPGSFRRGRDCGFLFFPQSKRSLLRLLPRFW